MKKLKFLLPLFAILLLLCSCDALDEMKNCHALDYGDGTLKLNNQTYKLLDVDYDGYIVYNHGRDIRVTDPDVPVLLSQSSIAKYLPSVSEDETIIYNDGYYIREDKYDYFVNTIQKGVEYTEYYCGKLGYQSDYPTYYFSDSQNNGFELFINSQAPVKTNEPIYTDDFVWVSCESADGIFRKGSIYQIIKTDSGYSVLDYTGDGYYNLYASTSEYDSLFDEIFSSAEN